MIRYILIGVLTALLVTGVIEEVEYNQIMKNMILEKPVQIDKRMNN